MERISTNRPTSLCVQPTFLIGTFDENGVPNFAPITWICASWNEDHFVFVINMDGEKKSKDNVALSGIMSANLVSTDMLDFFGAKTGLDGEKKGIDYSWSMGEKLKVPTLDRSRYVYELEVERTIPMCETTTMYLCAMRNIQVLREVFESPEEYPDLTALDPVIYSGRYHSIDECLGAIGDFWKP